MLSLTFEKLLTTLKMTAMDTRAARPAIPANTTVTPG